MSEQKTKYKLYIFGEATRKWRLHSRHNSRRAANKLARYFESLSYKVQIRRKGKVV